MTDTNSLYEAIIPGGAHWSMLIRKGITLRLIDEQGGANVGMLLYNPHNKLERYNAPDTLKCQHTFKLTAGHCLYSDMGHIFCSITSDSVGWHDTVGGNLSDAAMRSKWGVKTYQTYRNDWTISGDHAFMVELAKYGLNRRDMAANLNLFSKVAVAEDGTLDFVINNSRAGDHIDLRFEMDTLVLFHTCPHPMNPSPTYPKCPVRYQLSPSEPVSEDDMCLRAHPENRRGFENNRLYHLCGGH